MNVCYSRSLLRILKTPVIQEQIVTNQSQTNTTAPLIINTHKQDRDVLNLEWLGLVPGSFGRWNAIDEIRQGNQSISVGHVQGFESSVVQLTCNNKDGKPVTYTIPTDKYNSTIGDENWQTIARLNLGEGAYISNALQQASGMGAKELRKNLKEPPYRVTLDKTHVDAMDVICQSTPAGAIMNSPSTRISK